MARPLTYVVEHMEEDYGDWCHLEYVRMIEAVRGTPHRVRFTNLPDAAAARLRAAAPEADATATSVHALGLDVRAPAHLSARPHGFPSSRHVARP